MNKGRHDSGRSTAPIGLVVGITSVVAGVILLPPALVELFRYSPYEDPGAGRVGLVLFIGFLACTALPLLWLAGRHALAGARAYRAWKRTLTPRERTLVTYAEVGALFGAHIAFRDYNRRESARLTESVMGDAGKHDYLARGGLEN